MPASTKETAVRTAKRAMFILLALAIAANMNAVAQELEYVGSHPTNAHWLDVAGEYAYIGDVEGSFQIIRITDPTDPTLMGDLITGFILDILVRGNYAYISVGDEIQVINVADPSNPTYVGSQATSYDVWGIFVSGNLLYAAEYKRFEIFDISDPADPNFVGYYENPLVSQYGSIFVCANYAYAAANGIPYGCMGVHCALDVFDVSNPASPALIGSLTEFEPFGVSVAGDYAYIAAGMPIPLYIADVSDPTDPNITGTWSYDAGGVKLFVAGPYVYLPSCGTGVFMLNIADPANPALVASYDTPYTAWDIYVAGEYVYVADETSFIILRFVNAPCTGSYIPGDCNANGVPLQLADVMAMIGLYRGNILPGFTCDCSPHGHIFAPQADPNGNCVAYELNDVVTEIAAYRGSGTVSGCQDCPPTE